MEFLKKLIDWFVYLLIGFSILSFIYGTYEMINLFFTRG